MSNITPAMQAAFLDKYAKCIGIVGEDKYYVYEMPDSEPTAKGLEHINEKAFRVTYVNGEPVFVITLGKDIAETIINCYKLQFGEN